MGYMQHAPSLYFRSHSPIQRFSGFGRPCGLSVQLASSISILRIMRDGAWAWAVLLGVVVVKDGRGIGVGVGMEAWYDRGMSFGWGF